MMRTWIRFDPSRAWRLGSGAWRCSPAPRRARRRPLRSGDRRDGSSRQIGNGPLRAMLPRRREEPAAGDTRDCPTVARSPPLRSTASARPPRPQAREEAGHDHGHASGPAPEAAVRPVLQPQTLCGEGREDARDLEPCALPVLAAGLQHGGTEPYYPAPASRSRRSLRACAARTARKWTTESEIRTLHLHGGNLLPLLNLLISEEPGSVSKSCGAPGSRSLG